MDDGPPSRGGEVGQLHSCIRDLAALHALPSMCIGRTPEETLDLVIDALPTALGCDVVYLALPGAVLQERASLGGVSLDADAREMLARVLATPLPAVVDVPGAGARFVVQVEVPLSGARGRLVAGRVTSLDAATERVLLQTAANIVGTTLESANVLDAARRKDEFLAMLGHELRNPLAPILTAVELLAGSRERDVIERHTRHLARMVDDLLDISRVTRGHVELRTEQVSLQSVLQRALELAAPLLQRSKLAVHVDSGDGVSLRGDPDRLAQVFGNLLTNAAKFTPPQGSVVVSVVKSGDRVRIAVRDDGRGIPADELARIFEPFVQVDRGADALRGGLGLGLAIVHDLVVRHGGSTSVHSDGPGRGATFTVELPVMTEATVAPTPVARPRALAARSAVRVLVVDDDTDLAELLSEALRGRGFQTAVAYDARTAFETWRAFVPHAAVLDLGLPEVDGYELARRLRIEHGGAPTLIAATGYGERKDRLRTADAGFNCHFVKPVSVQDLVHVLDEQVVSRSAAKSP